MPTKVAINGFGRIGRNVLRAGLKNPDIEFVATNDLTDTKTLAHLLKYDSVLGPLNADVKAGDGQITVNGKSIKVFAVQGPGRHRLVESRRADRHRIHRHLHRRREGKGPPAGNGEEGHHLGAGQERGRHARSGRQRRQVRCGQAPHRLQCILHDKLPGAVRQGPARPLSASRRAR